MVDSVVDGLQRVFVSYAGPDRPWAEWTAWQLEQAGYATELDAWDWRAGDDFVVRMSDALEKSDLVVALFSDDYFDPERWTRGEWTAALATKERLVPLVVRPMTTEIPAFLTPRLRSAIHGLDKTAAVDALLKAVNGPTRPTTEPDFPGTTAASAAPQAANSATATAPRLPDSVGRPEVWNVALRNPDFSGREVPINGLRDGLTSPKHRVPYVLHGVGGVGKTQIALEYAHRFASQYDLVWWIDAETAGQVPVYLTELATKVGIAKLEAGTEVNARALLEYLATQTRWLLIIDNAEDPAAIAPWLPSGDGHVLITSRDPSWQGIARSIDVNVFTRTESVTFLGERAPEIAADQADLLAEDLGDLPLALDQAAGVLTTTAMPADRYRRMLIDAPQIMDEGSPRSYSSSVAATVTIAAGRLRTEHPEAEPLLRLAAFLGPDPIPTEWLDVARSDLATVPTDTRDTTMWPWNSLPHLARYGLARLGGESVQVHRLTQAVLRDATDPSDAAATRADAANLLVANDPGDPESPANWPKWALISSHLTHASGPLPDEAPLRRLQRRTGLYLLKSGQSRAAHDLMARLHQACLSTLGEDHPDTLAFAQYLGYALVELGNTLAAHARSEDTLERRRRVLGMDHRDTLQSAHTLAVALSDLRRYEDSLALDEDTLERHRRVLGKDHPDTLYSAQGVAASLRALQRYEDALTLDEDTLERRRRVLGENHPDTLFSASSLAATLHADGQYNDSLALEQETRERLRWTLGEDHPKTLHSARSLANTLRALSRYEDALVLDQDVLQRSRRVLGEDHPSTFLSANDLAVTLHALQRLDDALTLHQETLHRRRRVLGEDHPSTLQSIHNLGSSLAALHRYRQAETVLKPVVDRLPHIAQDADPALREALGRVVILFVEVLKASGKVHDAQMVEKRRRGWIPRPGKSRKQNRKR